MYVKPCSGSLVWNGGINACDWPTVAQPPADFPTFKSVGYSTGSDRSSEKVASSYGRKRRSASNRLMETRGSDAYSNAVPMSPPVTSYNPSTPRAVLSGYSTPQIRFTQSNPRFLSSSYDNKIVRSPLVNFATSVPSKLTPVVQGSIALQTLPRLVQNKPSSEMTYGAQSLGIRMTEFDEDIDTKRCGSGEKKIKLFL